MTRTLVSGAVVALVAAAVAAWGDVLGITTVWPLLLAVAVGLAIAPVTLGRALAIVVGAATSWFVLALRAGFLPDVAASRAVVVVVGVVVLTVIAAASGGRVPLWAGLAGYAAFAGFYEPMFAANPTAFLTESPVALLVVLLTAGIGIAAAAVTDVVTASRRPADVRTSAQAPEGGAA